MIKILMAFVLLFCTTKSYAACDFSTDIKENANGTYTYTRDCHIEVGKTVSSVSLLGTKIDLLEKQIELKDIQIAKYEDRTQLWMDTSFKLNDKLMMYESTKKNDFWISFGLGVLTVVVASWTLNQTLR